VGGRSYGIFFCWQPQAAEVVLLILVWPLTMESKLLLRWTMLLLGSPPRVVLSNLEIHSDVVEKDLEDDLP